MDGGSGTTQDRLDIAALCETVLEEAGGPLSKAELRERIEKVRGLNEHFLPQVSERVVRVSHGRWGLVDRDLGVPQDAQAEALRALEMVLERTARALHVSELFQELERHGFSLHPELDEPELLGIAQQDPRFRVGRGHLVGLRSWDSLRRTTSGEAFAILRSDWPGPMSGEEFHARYCEIIEREVARGHLASRAIINGFEFDEASRTWDISPDEGEEPESEEDEWES